jgi:hypothetical protein
VTPCERLAETSDAVVPAQYSVASMMMITRSVTDGSAFTKGSLARSIGTVTNVRTPHVGEPMSALCHVWTAPFDQTRSLSGVVNAKITRTQAAQNAQRPIDTQRAKGPIKTQRVKERASSRGAQKAFAP